MAVAHLQIVGVAGGALRMAGDHDDVFHRLAGSQVAVGVQVGQFPVVGADLLRVGHPVTLWTRIHRVTLTLVTFHPPPPVTLWTGSIGSP